MADARITQPSFTAGEISPELYARRDLARYQVGLRKLLNGFVLPTGGVSNRAGTRFAAEVPDSAKNSNISTFEAAADEAYLLVWGDLVVRPMSFGVYVDNGGSPYTITTPYPHTSLLDIYQEQSNDVATVVHPNFPPHELSRFGPTTWTLEPVDFAPGLPPPTGLSAIATEGYTGYGGDKSPKFYTYVVSAIADNGEESLPSEEVVSSDDLVLGFEKNFVTVSWVPQGSGYIGAPIPSRPHTGSAGFTYYNLVPIPNDVTVTHLSVYSKNAVNNVVFKLAQRVSAGNYTTVVNQTANHPGGGWHDLEITVPYVVPAVGTFYTGVYFPSNTTRHQNNASHAAKAGNQVGVQAGFGEASGITPSTRAKILGDSAVVVDSYNIYKEENGIFGYIGNTVDNIFTDTNYAPSFSQGPQSGRNPFEGDENYPALVTFVQQRRVFARTIRQPQTIFMTQSGNFKNMGVSTPTRDDDAIEITLAARKKQDIYHIVPLEKGMIVFTRSGEWRVTGREGDVITPSSILPEPQTSHGSAKYLRPLVIGEQLLFSPRSADGVLELEFSIAIDRYKANDLGVLSRHLFRGRTIVAWDYAKRPDGIVYCILDNGTALVLTYLKDHEVWGWGRLETKGKYLDVSVVPEGGRDVPYFIIERRIGGVQKRYVEFLADRSFTDVRDAFFVDCGASLDVPVTIAAIAGGASTTITKVAHGLANGDTVELAGVHLYDAEGVVVETLDGRWIVAGVTANTFRITYELDNASLDPPVVAGDDHASAGWSYYDGTGVYRKAVSTVTGLNHLLGRTCVALCDGSVVEDLVPVDMGGGLVGVTFPRKYARVHIGLPYRSVVTTLDLLNPQGDDTGIIKGVPKWIVRVDRTRGVKIGQTEETAEELQPRDNENYGDPASMHSGLIPLTTWATWETDQPCAIVQEYPLPMTILSVTDEVEYGGTA